MSARGQVLFADDDQILLKQLERAMAVDLARWDVTFVLGGAAAVAHIASRHVDVVVTDLNMPDVDGHEVLRCARAHHPQARRIVYTGSAASLVDVDAHALIRKPTQTNVLRALIELAFTIDGDALRRLSLTLDS